MMCRDYGDRPGCLGEADERYTMPFDDIGKPPLYWCAFCGPQAHAMNDALTKAFATRGPEFVEELREAIDTAKAETPRH